MAERDPGQVGSYRILARLGMGAMARVYLAVKEGPGGFAKPAALKVVLPHLAMDPAFIHAFISEARLGGYLDHPSLVQVFDFGQDADQLYMAMEFVNGPTLRNVLADCQQSGRLIPATAALGLMVKMCQGLDSAHKARDELGRPLNLVHRDLKPSNILLAADGRVKVGDFGVARAESNLDRTHHEGGLKGTVPYMSPEQAWGKLTIDHRSDLFALGLLLYEVLTLETLYQGESAEMVRRRAQDVDIEPRLVGLPDMPLREEILGFLRRALAPRPEDRFTSGGEMAAQLREMLQRMGPGEDLETWLARVAPPVVDLAAIQASSPTPEARTQAISPLLRSHPSTAGRGATLSPPSHGGAAAGAVPSQPTSRAAAVAGGLAVVEGGAAPGVTRSDPRSLMPSSGAAAPQSHLSLATPAKPPTGWLVWALGGVALLLVAGIAWLLLRPEPEAPVVVPLPSTLPEAPVADPKSGAVMVGGVPVLGTQLAAPEPTPAPPPPTAAPPPTEKAARATSPQRGPAATRGSTLSRREPVRQPSAATSGGTGTLQLFTCPALQEVREGGKALKINGRKVTLPAGPHTLTVVAGRDPEYKQTIQVNIEAGQTLSREINDPARCQ